MNINEYECTIKKESLAMYMIRMIKQFIFFGKLGLDKPEKILQ